MQLYGGRHKCRSSRLAERRRDPALPSLSMRPEFRQFGALRADDFARHPVWAQMHTTDYDESWYDDDDLDEESFRPHEGPLPVSPEEGMYLVAAEALLADGSTLSAFLTPASGDDLGLLQPHVFARGKAWGFWGGLVGMSEAAQDEFHSALGKSPEQVFPLQVGAQDGLATGVTTVTVRGWSGGGAISNKPRSVLRRLFGG